MQIVPKRAVDKKDPVGFGEYILYLKTKGLTQTAIAEKLGQNKSELSRYVKIGRWSKDLKDFANKNREILGNTRLIKAARDHRTEEEAFTFLKSELKKLAPVTSHELRIVKDDEDKEECNRVNDSLCKENVITGSEAEYLHTEEWVLGIKIFFSSPLIFLGSIVILALTTLLIVLQYDAYKSASIDHGLWLAIACETSLVVQIGRAHV